MQSVFYAGLGMSASSLGALFSVDSPAKDVLGLEGGWDRQEDDLDPANTARGVAYAWK